VQSYQPELYRLKGELLERDGLAEAGEALTWELRAAKNLVRLRERQGKRGIPITLIDLPF
jgi:hypothetical protein